MHIHNALREDAEFLKYAIAVDTTLLHGVIHFDAVTDELHHVFVRRNNRAAPTCFTRLARKGGDDVVGLKALDLFASDIERFGCGACKGHLRAQIFGHRVAVGFVLVIHIIAKRMTALVENDGHMGHVTASISLNIALEHVAKTSDGANWQTIGFTRQRRQRVIGAKNEGGAINQMQMASFVESRAHVKMPPKRFARWRHTRRVRQGYASALCTTIHANQ